MKFLHKPISAIQIAFRDHGHLLKYVGLQTHRRESLKKKSEIDELKSETFAQTNIYLTKFTKKKNLSYKLHSEIMVILFKDMGLHLLYICREILS